MGLPTRGTYVVVSTRTGGRIQADGDPRALAPDGTVFVVDGISESTQKRYNISSRMVLVFRKAREPFLDGFWRGDRFYTLAYFVGVRATPL